MTDKEMSEAELRARLKPRARPPEPVVKGRQWVMTDRDIAAFMKLLRETFPTIVFLVPREAGERGPGAKLLTSPIGFRVGIKRDIHAIVPPEGWDAKEYCAQPPGHGPRTPETHFWFRVSWGPYVRTQESGRVVENLSTGYLRAGHMRSDHETARFLARVWRMPDKITTNRVKNVDHDTGGTLYANELAGERIGFDALAWCQQRLNRVLDSSMRPTDDWVMPASPYYDRRRRVVKHDVAAYWAEIDEQRDRIPLFCHPIGYRRSDGALVTANDIGLDVDQLIPVEELDRTRLAALVRRRWELGEWQEYFNAREWVTLEKAIAGLETLDPDKPTDFHLGVSKLKSAIWTLRQVPEFRQYLVP